MKFSGWWHRQGFLSCLYMQKPGHQSRVSWTTGFTHGVMGVKTFLISCISHRDITMYFTQNCVPKLISSSLYYFQSYYGRWDSAIWNYVVVVSSPTIITQPILLLIFKGIWFFCGVVSSSLVCRLLGWYPHLCTWLHLLINLFIYNRS